MRVARSYLILFISSLFLVTLSIEGASGATQQFAKKFTVGGKSSAIIIVGYIHDKKEIEKLLDMTVAHAKEVSHELDASNSQGELGRFNAAHGGKPVKVSKNLLHIFKAGKRSAEWSDGAFDITAPSSAGNYESILIDEKASTVHLKKPEMQVSFETITDGFLADVLIRYIYAAGMKNSMVKIGTVFRGLGNSTHGPWTVQVQDDAGTYAHRAVNMALGNAGFATLSASAFRSAPLIDPRSKTTTPITCKGVTVAMNEAALAQGIAHALFVLGPEKGLDLLKRMGNARGLIVDAKGNFLRSPGF